MHLPPERSLEQVLSQLTFAHAPDLPRKFLFWGEGAGRIASYIAGWMAGQGMDVIVLDGANRFDPYIVSSFAKKASLSPEGLLRRIRLARAFTCYQMATLVGEKLAALLREEERVSEIQKPWVMLLGPITTFLDEDVPEREARPLFERMLKAIEERVLGGVPFFLFQPYPMFMRVDTIRSQRRYGGLVDSRGTFLAKRLFQISTLIWRIRIEDQWPRVILEKIPKDFSGRPNLGSGFTLSEAQPIF